MTTNDVNGTPENPTGGPVPSGSGPANVREGATIPQAPDEAAREADPDWIKLTDGRWAYVGTGKGRLVLEARKIMNDDGENFSDAIAALCTKIDGRPVLLEDLYELPLVDFMGIVSRSNVKNVR